MPVGRSVVLQVVVPAARGSAFKGGITRLGDGRLLPSLMARSSRTSAHCDRRPTAHDCADYAAVPRGLRFARAIGMTRDQQRPDAGGLRPLGRCVQIRQR